MSESTVTTHGEFRVRKRLGLPKKTVKKLTDKALEEGKQHKDFKGSFKRYLDSIFLKERTANNIRVYGNYLFLFKDSTLITLWNIPNKYKKTVSKSNDQS